MSKTFVIFLVIFTTAFAGAVFFLYLPLGSRIKDHVEVLKGVEEKVAEARQFIQAVEKTEESRPLLASNKTSAMINEITRLGKTKGLNFISLSPQAAGLSEDGVYRVLPVDMEVEANYQGLGEFLEACSTLEAMLTVEKLNVTPAKENPTLLKMKLTLHLYLEPGDAQ